MLSPTLRDGLAAYEIGDKLRALRLKKKLGLVELGRHTGLSPALLSKIERGKLFPTLPTLLRIALVFSVGLDSFFAGDAAGRRVAVVRQADRLRFPESPDRGSVAYHFESLDFPAVERKLNAYLAEFEAAEPAKVVPHTHPGAEFLYVMRGRLGLTIAREDLALGTGDSAYFDATLPHGYRRIGGTRCSAIVVTVP
jgi:transcriptional regulator with XRE-family HTH domain